MLQCNKVYIITYNLDINKLHHYNIHITMSLITRTAALTCTVAGSRASLCTYGRDINTLFHFISFHL